MANEAAKASPGHDVLGRIRNENLIMVSLIQNSVLEGIVRKFLHDNEYVTSGEVYQDLASKLQGVPPDQVQPPKASIAGPAMEGLAYSLDEPALKEMYLNLLASAVNSAKADQVHPSFVRLIQDLSAEETVILDVVLQHPVPAVRFVLAKRGSAIQRVATGSVVQVLDPVSGEVFLRPDLPAWINNWERLGLVELTFDEVTPEGAEASLYDWVGGRPEYRDSEEQSAILEDGPWDVEYKRGILRPTARGRQFYKVVSQPN